VTDSASTADIRARLGRLGGADILVAISGAPDARTAEHVVRAALVGLATSFPDLQPVVLTDTALPADEPDPADYVESVRFVRPPNPARVLSVAGATPATWLAAASTLHVRAAILLDGSVRSALPEWIELLAAPVLAGRVDAVFPRYHRHRNEAAVTNLVAYPLLRALWRQPIRQAMSGDVALGAAAVARLAAGPAGAAVAPALAAAAGGLRVCEASLGIKAHDALEPVGRMGPLWQETLTAFAAALDDDRPDPPDRPDTRPRSSAPLPRYGFERVGDPPPVRIDPVSLLHAFEVSAGRERGTWTRTFSPATTSAVLGLGVTAAGVGLSARDWLNLDRGADVGRLDTVTLANAMSTFAFPDDVWARVVFETLAAVRRGDTAALAAAEPIFLGRAASFIVEARRSSAEETEALVERQAREFERLAPDALRRQAAAATGAAREVGAR
jgi:hypothetical protein